MSIANLYAGGTKTEQNLVVNNLDVTGDLTVVGSLEFTGNLQVDGTLTVDGISTFNDNVFVGDGKNISVANGNVAITTGDLSINNGEININTGDITTGVGDITTLNGDIKTDAGTITTLNGNIISNVGNIIAIVGDITSSSGEVFADNSASVGAVGNILVARGSHSFANGTGPGVNTLTISGLDGNAHLGYILKINYLSEPTNSNNFLTMKLDSLSNTSYSNRVIVNGVIQKNNSGQDAWAFIDPESGTTKFGNATFDMFLNKSILSSNDVHMCGIMSGQEPINNTPDAYLCSYAYSSGNPSTISELIIDVSNSNHTGWDLFYSIFRYT